MAVKPSPFSSSSPSKALDQQLLVPRGIFCPFPNLVAPGPSLPTLYRFPIAALLSKSKLTLKHCSYITCQSRRPGIQYSSDRVKIQKPADVQGSWANIHFFDFLARSHPYPLNMVICFSICFGHICQRSSCLTW